MKSGFAFVFFAGLVTVTTVLGIDTRAFYEQKCLKAPPAQANLDFGWASKIGIWHMTAASRLNAYRTAAEIAGVKETELAPHDLFYKACIRFVWGADTIMTGFGGKKADVGMKPAEDGSFNFRYSNLGLDGKASVVFTDNQSFMMHYVCWPGAGVGQDQASWAVISSVPVLPEKTKKIIVKKIKEMGFSEKQFTTLRCASCITLAE